MKLLLVTQLWSNVHINSFCRDTCYIGLHEESLGIAEFHEVGRTLLEELHEESLGIVEFHKVGRTLLEGLHEESLGIVESHEVGRTLL